MFMPFGSGSAIFFPCCFLLNFFILYLWFIITLVLFCFHLFLISSFVSDTIPFISSSLNFSLLPLTVNLSCEIKNSITCFRLQSQKDTDLLEQVQKRTPIWSQGWCTSHVGEDWENWVFSAWKRGFGVTQLQPSCIWRQPTRKMRETTG